MSNTFGKICYDITEVNQTLWNACANPASSVYNPFVDYRFLHALEKSGSVSNEQGWQPFHVCLNVGDEAVGFLPLYLKSHSRGEYVFDGGWANAWHQAGGRYYPKLQASIPFTPATGSRLLVKDGVQLEDPMRHLLAIAMKLVEQINVSSLHITFMPKVQWDLAGTLGMLQRVDTQFHWYNGGYASFDDFLKDLSSKKRKNIRRERRDACSEGISIEWLTGADLTESHWDAFYEFYVDTSYRKWGSNYLNREFFSLISESMPESILLILCKRNNRYIAGAINFIGGDTLFGRNWGCVEDHRFLHFEVCYYQAIEFAIEHNLASVEAGAQGSHKIARGYMPRPTYSAHWVQDPQFRNAVARFVEEERGYVRQDIEWVEARTPYRRDINLAHYRQELSF